MYPVQGLKRLLAGQATPAFLLRLSASTLTALFVVVSSGAFVRLTGSGLGCENWPRCGDKPYPEQGFHAFVEFGNRLVALAGILLTLATWLAVRRAEGVPRRARLAALAAFLGAALQIPLGGVTVLLELHPLAVMAHFLLALAVVALAVLVLVEIWGLVGGWRETGLPPVLARLARLVGLPLTAALIVTGAVATAAGPHSGSDQATERLGITITDAVSVHVRVAAALGLAALLLGVVLLRRRRQLPGLSRLWGSLALLLLAQAVVGEVQYRSALPWGLVLGHVFLSAGIWTLAVCLLLCLGRGPAALLGSPALGPLAGRPSLADPASQKVP